MSWRLGIATGVCIDQPIAAILPAIRAAGADGIEVDTPARHFDPEQPDAVVDLARAIDEASLEAVSIHAPFGGSLDLAHPDPRQRRAALSAAMASADAIARLGGRIVVTHPSDLPRHAHDVQARLDDAVHSLTVLADHCARQGTTLVVESPLPHLIGGAPDEFAFVVHGLPASVGVCLDTGHAALGHHWHALVEVASARLRHVHASDNHGHRDDHLPPGLGTIDWSEIASSLRAAHFDGWIMLELSCPTADPIETYLREAYVRAIDRLAL
jgi:sugar phosphate isomerase/epimerase